MTYDLPPTSLPIRSTLLSNLTQQSALLAQLFTLLSSPTNTTSSTSTLPVIGSLPSLPSSSSSSHPINTIYSSLYILEHELSLLVEQAYAHQSAWGELMRRKSEVEGLERKVRGLVRELKRDVTELEAMVEEGKEVRGGSERSEKEPILALPLLAHAHSLSTHSSAPVSSLVMPHTASSLPWPSEASMRMGVLFAMQGSMSGVGDTGVIGDETKNVPEEVPEMRREVLHEETGRRFDPNAVYDLDLNTDSEEE